MSAHLNNEGINELLRGNDQKAIDLMTQSIQMLKQEISCSVGDSSGSCVGIRSLPAHGTSDQQLLTVEIPHIVTTDKFVVFSQAVHIPHSDTSSQVPIDVHVRSAAVIFNLALVHHLQAIRTQSPLAVRKAMHFYGMALKLFAGSREGGHVGKALLIELGAINNIAALRVASGDSEIACFGLEKMDEIVGRANQEFLNEPTVERLLQSMMILRAPKIAPAA